MIKIRVQKCFGIILLYTVKCFTLSWLIKKLNVKFLNRIRLGWIGKLRMLEVRVESGVTSREREKQDWLAILRKATKTCSKAQIRYME